MGFDIEAGQLVKILPSVSDFYPNLVNKVALVAEVNQYAGDSLTHKKEFTLIIDGVKHLVRNSHPSSTVSIDGCAGGGVVFSDLEMFSVLI